MMPYTKNAWGSTRTLHEAVHEPSYFPHFLLFKQYLEPKAVCILMHIVRKEFRSWIHYHKQRKLAFIALEWKCYKRTRAISRVRLYPVMRSIWKHFKRKNFPQTLNVRGAFSIFCPFAFKARSTTLIYVECITFHQTNLLDDLSCFHRPEVTFWYVLVYP